MRCGISTACFYPMNTLEAFKHVAGAGVPVTEIFINTFSELEDDYIARLDAVRRESGIRVSSIHPFSSSMEGFFFGTEYPGKIADGLKLYRRFFEVCRVLGADKLVFHGDHDFNVKYLPAAAYAQHFMRVAQLGREYGVALCHENVAYCRLQSPRRVQELKPLLGEYAAFVLDVKQVRRRRGSLNAMARAMAGAVRQVHISDYTKTQGCLPPGQGEADLEGLIKALYKGGYRDDLLVELYSDNYDGVDALVAAMRHVDGLIQRVIS